MILLILLDGSPFLIIGNFIEGIIFIMIILPPTTRNVGGIINLMTTQKHISYSTLTANKGSNIKFIFTINNKQSAKDYNK